MAVFLDLVSFWNKVLNVGCGSNFSKKIIGFDYGTHKIGVSISDYDRNFAFPKEVLIGDWRNIDDAVDRVFALCRKYNSNVIVIGFPKKNDGSNSENCDKILQFASLLNRQFGENFCVILLFDERFSTKSTTSVFNTRLARNVNTKKKQKINSVKTKTDDASAASVILSDVLLAKTILT